MAINKLWNQHGLGRFLLYQASLSSLMRALNFLLRRGGLHTDGCQLCTRQLSPRDIDLASWDEVLRLDTPPQKVVRVLPYTR